MESLLGQFYNKIRGSQEDIASEGLTYVLQRSSAARQALSKIIKFDCGLIFDDINYSTQNAGEKLERPDISGINENGKEVIILEAKFWASLTDNQPVEYLGRLDNNNSVLIFIVPTLRVRPVFNDLRMRLANAGINCVPDNTNHSFRLDNNRILIVKTWNEILQIIRQHLVQAHEQTLLSDLDQIIGFCETIDKNSFQPYQREDFSPKIAKKMISFCDLADNVVSELTKRGLAHTDGFKSTGQRRGYSKYFGMKGMGVVLEVNFYYWEKAADTPIWFTFMSGHWKQPGFKMKFKNVAAKDSIIPYEDNGRLYMPIYPLVGETEDRVINAMAERIIKLTDELSE